MAHTVVRQSWPACTTLKRLSFPSLHGRVKSASIRTRPTSGIFDTQGPVDAPQARAYSNPATPEESPPLLTPAATAGPSQTKRWHVRASSRRLRTGSAGVATAILRS